MQSYKEIILGDSAINYVRQHLAYGKSLSHNILIKLDLEAGHVTTGMPDNANLQKINNFEYGGILPDSPKSTWHEIISEDGKRYLLKPKPRFFPYVIDSILYFLKRNADRICIFENANAKSADPLLSKYKSIIWILRDEVYHVITSREYSISKIETTINEAQSLWTFVGFMTSLPVEKQSLIKKEISLEIINLLAEKIEKIVFGAYDGEGFLIWRGKL